MNRVIDKLTTQPPVTGEPMAYAVVWGRDGESTLFTDKGAALRYAKQSECWECAPLYRAATGED